MKKICVIGAGSSGLTAIKSCKEENMQVDCFEMSDNFGGLWRFHEDDVEYKASVMKSTVINTSKEMSAFSDFPPPKEFANFMHNTSMLEYFKLYAEYFQLLKHIKYNKKVIKVDMADDYETSGGWLVTVQDLKISSIFTNYYDGVMVCAGHHTFPYKPDFQGLDKFRGQVMHTHSLKSAKGFEDKNVLIIGIGNSAVDAATEISRVSKKVYLSSRRSSWIIPKLALRGVPMDMFMINRLINFLFWLNQNIVDVCLQFLVNLKIDHVKYRIKPEHGIFNTHPTISEFLPNCLQSGTVVLKPNVNRFTENGAVFENESKITEVDHIILATGYQIEYPFLQREMYKVEENLLDLYKLVFPPHLPHSTLAFIGLIQPIGCIFPIAEAQSRWFAQLMKNKCRLPSTNVMKEEVQARHKNMAKRYIDSPRHTIQVDFILYMDEICSEFGAKPNLWKLALKDPVLFYACLTEGCASYQYRLEGPHVWHGARDAILTMGERVQAPLQTSRRF